MEDLPPDIAAFAERFRLELEADDCFEDSLIDGVVTAAVRLKLLRRDPRAHIVFDNKDWDRAHEKAERAFFRNYDRFTRRQRTHSPRPIAPVPPHSPDTSPRRKQGSPPHGPPDTSPRRKQGSDADGPPDTSPRRKQGSAPHAATLSASNLVTRSPLVSFDPINPPVPTAPRPISGAPSPRRPKVEQAIRRARALTHRVVPPRIESFYAAPTARPDSPAVPRASPS